MSFVCAACHRTSDGNAYGFFGEGALYCSSVCMRQGIMFRLADVPDEDLVNAMYRRVHAGEPDEALKRAFVVAAAFQRAIGCVFPKDQIAVLSLLIAQELRR